MGPDFAAAADFREWVGLLRRLHRITEADIDVLRPLIDGLYEDGAGPFPGTTHTFLQLRRDVVVLADLVETVSQLIPHERIVRLLARAPPSGR